ncbi:hypothetical protein ACTTAI_05260 [Rhodobacter capsulatus]|uniref:hypothetical protein n=1 Tax=Rhodobacter capsulatus TaxID=1061 RepID=UPI004027F420
MGVFPEILVEIDAGLEGRAALPGIDRLLSMAEEVLVTWIISRGEPVEVDAVEGHWLLGLHRQGCRATPGFSACRDICREIVFRRNIALLYPEEAPHAHRMMAMTVKHLALFVGGKLEQAGLGQFCRASHRMQALGAA